MSYIVLARKKNALSSGKIVHAYLFSGPRGVGKTSSARILAKALNCRQRPDSEPCGECRSCKSITQGASVDVLEIDGASNTSVDAVRELREAVKYAPSGGKYKIYIIDEVHMLSTPAFNALLKTLEEPPAHVIFIFATTEPKKIPSTILSRCQHHSFRRITKNMIKGQLNKIIDTEKINIRESALEMIAKAADGSMRDALTLLDQATAFSNDITAEELQTLLGLPETEIILNLSKTILTGDVSSTLYIIKELTDRGSDLRQITKDLVEYFRNIAIVKISREAEELLEFSQEEAGRLRDLASDVNIEQLTLLLTELLRLEGEIRNAVNPRYALELGLLRTSFVKGMTSIGDIFNMLTESKGNPQVPGQGTHLQGPAVIEEKKTAPVKNPAVNNKSDVQNKEELWHKLLEHLNSKDHLLACKLEGAKIINLTTTELVIGFNGGMSVLADSVRKNSSVIEAILKNLSAYNLKLKILSLPGKKTKKSIDKIKEHVLSEPIVKDAMKIFNGSLIKVKSLEDESNTNCAD
jgi:DNA polymerase-3 subunit gamma/tau